ncbi:GNAT family N-acetyltransferase [Synechococcus sp. PCC 6312]|uniref:GNAT family N-acetyltransferase n=1 Tax=Synechococcus sp. (strain ATCC 27167 / PCC 6312) TaxID=195253 RepID=UPI00029F2348|nr:GNAT family N-acetyltransferase [Synechococcus sp. PCC 6312]AFY62452.1 acetyltransferase [Synechococcus sp. PCC 6312]
MPEIPYQVRRFIPADAPQIAQLFHDTIHRINAQDYCPAQIQAWAPDDLHFCDWASRCGARITFVAIDPVPGLAMASDKIIGFGELESSGHIGCFYGHWQYQRRGVGRLLYQALENEAITRGLESLRVEASITARPFFERMGFSLIEPQQVFCRGQWLLTNRMLKCLTRA